MGTNPSSIARPVDLEIIKQRNPFNLDDYDEIRGIGKGSFAQVTLIKNRITGKQAALKTLLENGEDDAYLKEFLGEIQLLSHIQHPCIVHFIGYATTPNGDQCYAVEHFENGSLDDLFESVPESERQNVLTPTQKTIITLGLLLLLITFTIQPRNADQ